MKSYGEPYVNHAAKVMLGAAKLKDLPHNPHGWLCGQDPGVQLLRVPQRE